LQQTNEITNRAIDLSLLHLGIYGAHPSFEKAAPANQGSPHHRLDFKAQTDPQFTCGLKGSVYV
jgi:hypothetical protein